MPIVLIGLSHHTAPVHIREKLTLVDCGLRMAFQELPLARSPGLDPQTQINGAPTRPLQEAVILSTCNRLEIYGATQDAESACQAIMAFLGRLQDISPAELAPHLYVKQGREATAHLMRVTAGLDSLILGEPQILGQTNFAFQEAQAVGAVGPILSHLFGQAIHAGKRARTETAISRHTTSVSHAAVLLAKQKWADLAELRVLMVGAGEMADLAADTLLRHGVHHFRCINRTHSRAVELAQRVNGTALSWYDLPEALAWADLIFTATGAPHTVIHAVDVAPSLAQRPDRPLTIIDMAVPRDVEEAVGRLPGVICHDIDDLHATLDANLAHREAAIPDVEQILAEEVERFEEWLHGRRVVDTIVDLRRQAEAVARCEVDGALARLGHLDARQQEVVSRLAHRLVNKLLHEPTVRLKSHAANGNGHAYAHLVRDLFGLETGAIPVIQPLEGVGDD